MRTVRMLFAMALGAVILHSGSALAQAVVLIDATECGVSDADFNGHTIFPPFLGNAVVHTVVTPSGNTKVTCSGTLPAEAVLPTKGAVVITIEDIGVFCNTLLGPTDDWQNVVTKSGRVSLSCHLNGQN